MVAGRASKKWIQWYRAVADKFDKYAAEEGVEGRESVSKSLVEGYAVWLDDNGYAHRTEYLELTTIKQAIRWMVDGG